MNTTNYIRIFRGDDSDALGYQTIVGTIKTDIDLAGCKAVFRFLGFYAEFNPIPEDKKLTIVIPAQASRGFPPGVGYASLKVIDALGKIRTFTNRIPVIVDTMTPSCGCGEFEVSFSPFPELEPLKIFIGPNSDDFDQYTGFVSKIIDRASLVKYGLVVLADAMSEDSGANGKAASPLAVKAAYDAIIKELTDNYYDAEQTEEAIDRVAAYYITRNTAGDAFETKAQLDSTTVFYSGGEVRVPTRNDYCVVLADETHGGAEYRYIYAVAEGETTGRWQPQFPVEGVMTVDQTVQKNSQNPVSGGGVWSAIWGALAALPTGFSSLYDWCVAQLAGKASKADATLTNANTWTFEPATYNGYPIEMREVEKYPSTSPGVYFFIPYARGSEIGAAYYDTTGYATSLSLQWNGPEGDNPSSAIPLTATRTALQGYQLGSQSDKPLASEAEAEALRTGKQDALSAQQLANIAAVSDALAFDATHTYAAGDPVVYNGTLYTFTEAHAGAWTGSDVSAVDIIARLAGKLDNSQTTPDGLATLSFISVNDEPRLRMTGAAGEYIDITFSALRFQIPGYQEFDLTLPMASGTLALTAGTGHAGNLAALDANGNPTDSQIPAANVALKSNLPYAIGTPIVIDTASSETVEGETVYYGAATLADRTANIVQVTAATALDELRITFPAATSGKVRDFGLRVEIGTGSAALTAPALVPVAPTGETIKIENADRAIPELADGTATAKGVTLLYFSENAPGIFVVKGEQVEEVA